MHYENKIYEIDFTQRVSRNISYI